MQNPYPHPYGLNQYLINLIEEINATQQRYLTKKAIILTTLRPNNVTENISCLKTCREKKNTKNNCLPRLLCECREISTSIINAGNFLFLTPANKFPFYSTINLIYLLTFYTQVSFVIVVPAQALESVQSKQQVVAQLNKLGQILGSSLQNEKLHESLIFAVAQPKQNTNNPLNHLQQFKKIQANQNLKNKMNKRGKQILDHLIEQKKVISLELLQSHYDLAKVVQDKVQGFKTSPRILTELYPKILSQEQINMLKNVFKHQQSIDNNLQKFVQILDNAFENRSIFDEDEKSRLYALNQDILSQSPFSEISFKMEKISYETETKLPQQFAVQAAIFIFMELFKTENKFAEEMKQNQYLNYNTKIENIWEDNDFMSQSILSQIIYNIFSSKSIYYDHGMLGVANFLQIYFQMFQSVPKVSIREKQFSLIGLLHKNIIEKFIQFFYECLPLRINQILSNHIQPKQLLRLTGSIKKLMNFFKILSKKLRPMCMQPQQISRRAVIIVSTYFQLCWKCYEKYTSFWSANQKNMFMDELENLCRNQEYLKFLKANHQKTTMTILVLKKIYEYFGNYCFKRKEYYLAAQFFEAGKLYYRLIQTYESWLEKIYVNKQWNSEDITNIIEHLSDLGMIQKSRLWCYKFMDVRDNNSKLISLLQGLLQLKIESNTSIIKQMKYNQMNFVDKDIMTEVKKQLEEEDWLPMFEDFSNQ